MKRVSKVIALILAVVCMMASFAACGSTPSYSDVAGTYIGHKVVDADAEGKATLELKADGTFSCTEELPFGTFTFTSTYKITGKNTITLAEDPENAAFCPETKITFDSSAKTFEYVAE